MKLPTIPDLDLSGRTVLMRVDFNVTMDKGGTIQSDRRIVQALPSIERLLAQGPRLILMSHLGRPEGKGYESRYSMAPVAERLGQRLRKPVALGPTSVVGLELDALVARMRPGDVMLMENLRFHPGETLPDMAEDNPGGELLPTQQEMLDSFVASIAKLGDVYVNDAFGTCHRAHASMVGVPAAIRSAGGQVAAGLLVEKEIKCMGGILSTCESPFILILGGAKVADKIKLIERMLPKVDRLLIGGAMAYTFLKAMGTAVGKSRVDDQSMDVVKELLRAAGDKIVLPRDHVAADVFDPKAMAAGKPMSVEDAGIPDNLIGMDIGPKTCEQFSRHILGARTVLWNGPMGVSELPDYGGGTMVLAESLAAATTRGAMTIIGGGDTAAAVEALGMESRYSHVSTGGGASLAFLEGSPMPALEVLLTTAVGK